MKLSDLTGVLGVHKVAGAFEDFDLKGIACDSKKVSNNFLFVAIKGNACDGHNFIEEAISKGAKAAVIESGGSQEFLSLRRRKGAAQLIAVEDTRKALAALAAAFYGNPSHDLKVIGVTGTNGKTTISYLIETLLQSSGRNPGVIGTINYRYNTKVFPSKNTTPGPLEMQSMLRKMRQEGCDYAIAEISSHALDQERSGGIKFRSAIFTNLTQDHLDYHSSIRNYFLAKSKLFRALPSSSLAIINKDDAYGRKLIGMTGARVFTYAIDSDADLTAASLKFGLDRTEFRLKVKGKKIDIETPLIGRHNVYNMLAAASAGINEGLSLEDIRAAFLKIGPIPGRLEKVETKKDFFCFVDYAHTEDALRNVIGSIREVCGKKIIVVFGCGGDRDKSKRPKMGVAVTQLADYCIVTSDNPRSEKASDIIRDIVKGIKKDNYCVVPDRREAIKKSLSLAGSGDAVLIAGKGHENYQILGARTIHFDDRQEVRECLRLKNC